MNYREWVFIETYQQQGLLIERQKFIDLNRMFAMANLTWLYQHDITNIHSNSSLYEASHTG